MKRNTIIYLMGSFIFAFLLGEMVHEYGHFMMHLIFGHEGVSVVLDPFGGSKNIGVTAMPLFEVAWTTIMGPMTNVILAFIMYFVFIKTDFLPVKIWLPVALIQEGVTFSIGSLTQGGDAYWIAESTGIPIIVIIIIGVIFLVLGIWRLAYEVFRIGEVKNLSFARKYLILLISMGSLMLIRSVYSFVLAPSLIVENLVPLIFSILVAFIVVSIMLIFNKNITSKTVRESNAFIALGMGIIIFVLQLII